MLWNENIQNMRIIKKEELCLSEKERQDFANVYTICNEITHSASANTKLYNAAIEITKNIEYINQLITPIHSEDTKTETGSIEVSSYIDNIKGFKENLEKIKMCIPLKQYRINKCDKCVWSNECFPYLRSDTTVSCPSDRTYKRDPPDGGYYG